MMVLSGGEMPEGEDAASGDFAEAKSSPYVINQC